MAVVVAVLLMTLPTSRPLTLPLPEEEIVPPPLLPLGVVLGELSAVTAPGLGLGLGLGPGLGLVPPPAIPNLLAGEYLLVVEVVVDGGVRVKGVCWSPISGVCPK